MGHEFHDGFAAQLAAVKYRVEHRWKEGESVGSGIGLEETIKDIETVIIESKRMMANLVPQPVAGINC